MPSSTTTALSRQPLKEVLEGVTDPRDRRGVRHPLVSVLCLAVTGILAGCRSLTAIWEHAADLEPADLGALGLEEGRALPSESTIRRVLQDLDPAGLDARLTSWFFTRTGTIGGRRVIAVDGKTMRGARTGDNPAPHLLAAPGRASGVVVGQRRVSDKSNEIPALRDLLAPMDLDGAVVTADAMHTQKGTAEWIRSRGAHYLLTVKDNQPGLKRELGALPWKDVPAVSSVDTGHGRRVRRTVKAVQAPKWVDFPGAAQILQVRRIRTIKGRKHVEVAYPGLLTAHGAWLSPNRLPPGSKGTGESRTGSTSVCDVVFDEDRHQLRTCNGPEIMAALRNLAIGLIRLVHGPGAGIASTTRSLSRQPKPAIKLITQPST